MARRYAQTISKDALYKYFDVGFTVDEISKITGVTPKTIAKHLVMYRRERKVLYKVGKKNKDNRTLDDINISELEKIIETPIKNKNYIRAKDISKDLTIKEKEDILFLLKKNTKPKEVSLLTGIDIKYIRSMAKLMRNNNDHVIKPDSKENFEILISLKNKEISIQNKKIISLNNKVFELEAIINNLKRENENLKRNTIKKETFKISY